MAALNTWNVLSDKPLVSVVMPVFNEAHHIEAVVERVCLSPVFKQLIVVDDASSDGSWERLLALRARFEDRSNCSWRLIRLPVNRGKGYAVRTAIAEAVGDLVLIQDGDMEYDPADYSALISPILEGQASVVYGSRFASDRQTSPLWHRCGNRMLTAMGNRLMGGAVSDLHTGYKVFDTQLLKSIPLKEDRFGFDSEVTAALFKLGEKIVEVPVSYSPRSYAQGKKIGIRAIFDTIRVYGRSSLQRRRSLLVSP